MTRVVLLDAGPLGMVTHPGGVAEVEACKRWLHGLLEGGARVATTNVGHLSRLIAAELWQDLI